MNERINAKINEIQEYLRNVAEISLDNLEEYQANWKTKAICERLCEKITEAAVDLALIFFKDIIAKKDKNIRMPESDTDVFNLLEKRKVITKELSKRLQNAKGMRNIIAHEYGKIDDRIVFNAINEELEKDVNEFIDNIENYFEKIEEIKE